MGQLNQGTKNNIIRTKQNTIAACEQHEQGRQEIQYSK